MISPDLEMLGSNHFRAEILNDHLLLLSIVIPPNIAPLKVKLTGFILLTDRARLAGASLPPMPLMREFGQSLSLTETMIEIQGLLQLGTFFDGNQTIVDSTLNTVLDD